MVQGKIMLLGKMCHHKDKGSFFQKIKNVRLFDSFLLCDKSSVVLCDKSSIMLCETSVIVTDMFVLKLFCLDQYPRNKYIHQRLHFLFLLPLKNI